MGGGVVARSSANVVVGGGELSARLGDPPTGWACPVPDLLAEDGPFGPARAARRIDEVTAPLAALFLGTRGPPTHTAHAQSVSQD